MLVMDTSAALKRSRRPETAVSAHQTAVSTAGVGQQNRLQSGRRFRAKRRSFVHGVAKGAGRGELADENLTDQDSTRWQTGQANFFPGLGGAATIEGQGRTMGAARRRRGG